METVQGEIVEETQLAVIVKESGLEKTKAQILLDRFSDYFKIAADWENKAKMLVIQDVSQKAEMKMAREGRLFLKSKRIEVEKTRKDLKENIVREGKAIDGIANVLKALIEPIEEHLEQQEKYAERKEQERKNSLRIERQQKLTAYEVDLSMYSDMGEMADETFNNILETAKIAMERRQEAIRKAEAERIAKEKAEAEERERMRLENERLKAEAIERERLAKIEAEKIAKQREEDRKKQQAELAREKAKAEAEIKALEEKAKIEKAKQDAEAKRIKAESESRIAKERIEREKLQAELKAKQDAEQKEKARYEAERIAKEEAERKAKSAPDKDKIMNLAKRLKGYKIQDEMQTDAGKSIMQKIELGIVEIGKYAEKIANEL